MFQTAHFNLKSGIRPAGMAVPRLGALLGVAMCVPRGDSAACVFRVSGWNSFSYSIASQLVVYYPN